MYHDEFAKYPTKVHPAHGEDLLPSLPLEVGGGLSLGLAASLNQPISMVLFYLGGLLPLVTCSLAIAAHRASEFLGRLAPSLETRRPSALPVPHLLTVQVAAKGRFRPSARSRSAR